MASRRGRTRDDSTRGQGEKTGDRPAAAPEPSDESPSNTVGAIGYAVADLAFISIKDTVTTESKSDSPSFVYSDGSVFFIIHADFWGVVAIVGVAIYHSRSNFIDRVGSRDAPWKFSPC
jgi:hypothetical protein